MREYAWYSPEIDVIVFQSIKQYYYISFEWEQGLEAFAHVEWPDIEIDSYLWIPLGEV